MELQDYPGKIANAIGGFFTSLGTTLLDGIKELFLPREGFFDDYFEDMGTYFDEHFGFLSSVLSIFTDLLQAIYDSEATPEGFVFPELKYMEYTLIEEQTINLEDFVSDIPNFQTYMYMVTNVILVGSTFSLGYMKLRQVLR